MKWHLCKAAAQQHTSASEVTSLEPVSGIHLPVWGKFSYKLQSCFYITCTLVLYLSAFMPEKFAYLCNINQAPNFLILNFQQRRAKLYFLACCHSSESSLLTCKLIGLKIQNFCFIEEKDLEDTSSCIPWFIPANSDSHMHCPQYS